MAAEERDAGEGRGRGEGSGGVGGGGGGSGGRLANVEGGRNVRIITRTPWNPWHRGDGKRGRQIRTIAGVSRTALSVMVVVLLPSSSSSSSRSLPCFPPSASSVCPCLARALTSFHPLSLVWISAELSLSLSLRSRCSLARAIYKPHRRRPDPRELGDSR